MTKYNTGNPVGSADPRDLFDNSAVADNLVTGKASAYNDRLGKSRKSWQGMEDEFAAFIAASGYEFVGDYAAGIEITGYNQLVRDTGGEFWRVSGSTNLPYTTTGSGLPEGGAFLAVGDAALRQELNGALSSGLGANLVKGATIYMESVAEGFAGLPAFDGQVVQVYGFYEGAPLSLPSFRYKASYAKSMHDGFKFVSPTVPPISEQAGASLRERRDNFLAGVGETDPSGNGVFVAGGEIVTPEYYGAFGTGAAGEEDDAAVIAALNSQFYRAIGKPTATYLMTGQADITSQIDFYLAGATFDFQLKETVAALYVKSDFVEIHGGTITVTGSGGAETGGNGHSLNCITSGVQLTGEGWKNLKFHDLTVTTNRTDAGAHIGLMGECSRVKIYNITAPDNPVAKNVIGIEWGGNAGGSGDTGHPHDIEIKNIVVGKFTYGGTTPLFGFAVWVSSAFNVKIENIFVEEAYGAVRFYSGDKANDFAPARYKDLVGTGITAKNVGIVACIGRAIQVTGTGNSTSTILDMPVKVDGLKAAAAAGSADTRGFDGEQFSGVEIKRFKFSGFRFGINARALANNLILQDGDVEDCAANGAFIGASGSECYNPILRNVRFKRNNQGGGATVSNAAVRYINTTGGGVIGCTFGEEGETETQKYSVYFEGTCRDPEISDNFTWDHVAGGFSYIIGGTKDDTQINAHGTNNRSAPGVANHASAPIFDIKTDGTRHFFADNIPGQGTFAVGDKVWFTGPLATEWVGATCVTSGSPGTWKRFGQIEA